MRRAAPPQAVRVDPADPGPWSRVALGPRGLGLEPAAAPGGVELAADGRALHPVRGVPFATHEAQIVADGGLVVTAAPGVARSIRLPDLAGLFDRRPPGLVRVAGAALANACLLEDDAGWRAVVLPSLGDIAADLGRGPVAIRPDGRRVAVAHEGALYELELPGAAAAQIDGPGTPGALAYGQDGRVIAAVGSGIGADRGGAPIVALAAAARAPRAIAAHADGSCSVWDTGTGEPVARWTPPIAGPLSIGIGADGELATAGARAGEPAACVIRASDGALVRHVAGARTIALHPHGAGIVVGGEWGGLWLEPPREAR